MTHLLDTFSRWMLVLDEPAVAWLLFTVFVGGPFLAALGIVLRSAVTPAGRREHRAAVRRYGSSGYEALDGRADPAVTPWRDETPTTPTTRSLPTLGGEPL